MRIRPGSTHGVPHRTPGWTHIKILLLSPISFSLRSCSRGRRFDSVRCSSIGPRRSSIRSQHLLIHPRRSSISPPAHLDSSSPQLDFAAGTSRFGLTAVRFTPSAQRWRNSIRPRHGWELDCAVPEQRKGRACLPLIVSQG